jgi:hypothetical protein
MRRALIVVFLVFLSLQGFSQEKNKPLDNLYLTLNGGYHTGAGDYLPYTEVSHCCFNNGAIFSAELTGKLDNIYCGLDAQYWRHSQSISASESRMVKSFGASLQLYLKHRLGIIDLYGGGGPGVCTIKEDNRHGSEDSFLYVTLKARGGADINLSDAVAFNIDASVTGLSLLIDNMFVFSVKAGPKIRIF